MLRYISLLAYLSRGKEVSKYEEAAGRGVFYHYDSDHDDDYFDLPPLPQTNYNQGYGHSHGYGLVPNKNIWNLCMPNKFK